MQITQSVPSSHPVNMEENLPWCRPSLLKQPASRPDLLEVESKFSSHRARRDEVGSAEGGLEVVEGDFVCHVDGRQAQAPFVVFLVVEEIVVPQADVK